MNSKEVQASTTAKHIDISRFRRRMFPLIFSLAANTSSLCRTLLKFIEVRSICAMQSGKGLSSSTPLLHC